MPEMFLPALAAVILSAVAIGYFLLALGVIH